MCLLKVLKSQQVFTELLEAAGDDHSALGMFALRCGNETVEEKNMMGTVPSRCGGTPPSRCGGGSHRYYVAGVMLNMFARSFRVSRPPRG